MGQVVDISFDRYVFDLLDGGGDGVDAMVLEELVLVLGERGLGFFTRLFVAGTGAASIPHVLLQCHVRW